MKTRKMKVSDIPRLIKLWKKASLPLVNFSREKWDTELVIKLNPTSCLVLIDKDKIIGSILGTFNGRRAWIYHLVSYPNIKIRVWEVCYLKELKKF